MKHLACLTPFILVSLCVAPAHAQQRLYAVTASEVLELNASTPNFGDVLERVSIPAELRGSSATSVAGGRYLVWLRQFPAPQAGLVFFDTRTRGFHFRLLPFTSAILASDSTHPRLIVRAANSTVFPARHAIHIVDGPETVCTIDLFGLAADRFAYAADTGRIFVVSNFGLRVYVFSADIGWPLGGFPIRARFPDAVLADRSGRRVVVLSWTTANELEYELLDGETGGSLATNRLPAALFRSRQRQHTILDEARRRILTATADGIVALSLDTLAVIGRTDAPRLPPHLDGPFSVVFEVSLHARTAAAIGVALDRTRTPQSTAFPPRCLDAGLSLFDPNTGRVQRVSFTEACPTGASPPSFELVLVSGPEAPQASAVLFGGTVIVTWNSPATSTHYEVEAGSAPGLRDVAIVVTATTGISGVLSSGTYYVRVRALNDAAKGPYSNELRIVIP